MLRIFTAILVLCCSIAAAGSWLYIGGGSAPFTPNSIGGLTLWLDAQNSGSITQSGGLVSRWNDLTTGSSNFAGASGATRPTYTASAINGHPAMLGNGSSKELILNASALAQTIAIVFQLASTSAQGLLAGASGANPTMPSIYTGPNILEFYDGTAFTDFNFSASTSTPYIVIYRAKSTAATSDCLINGVAATINAHSAGSMSAGDAILEILRANPGYSSGYVGTVITYNVSISDGDRTLLNSFLTTEWN